MRFSHEPNGSEPYGSVPFIHTSLVRIAGAKLELISWSQCARKAYPYQFGIGAVRIRSRMNKALLYSMNENLFPYKNNCFKAFMDLSGVLAPSTPLEKGKELRLLYSYLLATLLSTLGKDFYLATLDLKLRIFFWCHLLS